MSQTAQSQVKLSQLKIMVAVAEQESFGQAALELGISQSAVSHAIASLEDSLGVVLFSRSRYGAQLTPIGSRILPHAQQAVSSAASILQEAEIGKGLEKGKVRIASFRSVATHVLPNNIKQLYEHHPGITTNILECDSTAQVEQSLREGRADIGIITLPAGKGITAWEMLKDEFVVLLPPGTQTKSNTLSWEELARQPLIMPPIDHAMMRPVFEHVNGYGYWLNVVNEIETDATTVNLVAQGLGGTILPKLAAHPIPQAVQVYSLPVPLKRSIGVAILTEALQPPVVYAFLDIVKSS